MVKHEIRLLHSKIMYQHWKIVYLLSLLCLFEIDYTLALNKSKTINILHLSTYNGHSMDIQPEFEFARSLVNERSDILPDYFVESYTYRADIVS